MESTLLKELDRFVMSSKQFRDDNSKSYQFTHNLHADGQMQRHIDLAVKLLLSGWITGYTVKYHFCRLQISIYMSYDSYLQFQSRMLHQMVTRLKLSHEEDLDNGNSNEDDV